jgi:endoribonuclease Dicer
VHFCSVIPNSLHADNQPLFERDPPEFPEGWHAFSPEQKGLEPYCGPYGCNLTLPRALPLPERQFSVERIYKTIVSARRHAAFNAYVELHQQGLLDDNLLPIANIIEPQLEAEVLAMLADVEKREGLAKVSRSIDPWAPENDNDSWFCSELTFEDLTPLLFFTKSEVVPHNFEQGPVLYRRGRAPQRTSLHLLGRISSSDKKIALARQFTRAVFWGLNHSRMDWESLNFSYLFLPIKVINLVWDNRRAWLEHALSESETCPHRLMIKADRFAEEFGYTEDMTLIQRSIGSGRPFKFIRWKYDALTLEEEERLRKYYAKYEEEVEITYPLLAVQPYPPRTNLLIPIEKQDLECGNTAEPPTIFLLPGKAAVIFLSEEEAEYAFLLPSILRFLSMSMTANSLRTSLFQSTPLANIPLSLLTVAITAPSSNDRLNYQRLETLGDAVLKFVVGVQLLAEYPLWHEGYLTKKKDHAVANVRLAKEDLKRGLYKWIIQGIFLSLNFCACCQLLISN